MKKIKELNKPKNIYNPGFDPENVEDKELFKQYKLKNTRIDPETGKSTSDVEYLPDFHKIKNNLILYRKSIQQFKYSTNTDISELSKKLGSALTKIINATTALEQMVNREQRKYK